MGESGAAELHPIEHLERILEEIGLGESTRARALLLAIRSLAHSALEPPAQQPLIRAILAFAIGETARRLFALIREQLPEAQDRARVVLAPILAVVASEHPDEADADPDARTMRAHARTEGLALSEATVASYERQLDAEHRAAEQREALSLDPFRSFDRVSATTDFAVDAPLAGPGRILPAGAIPIDENSNYVEIAVWFGTTRHANGGRDRSAYFGGERAEGMKLTMGRCGVSIPRDKRFGALPRPRWWRFQFSEDPAIHVSLLSIEELDPDRFAASLREEAPSSAMLFVHGYNVSFAAAARQAAQITYDIQFPGAPVIFSWPSRDDVAAYKVDEAAMEGSVAALAAFLEHVCFACDIRRVHLVAHSMGSRCLVRAATALLGRRRRRKLCRQLVLTAPDLDADELTGLAPDLVEASSRFTLYASSEDLAIKASRKAHAHARAGESGDNILILPNVDTVDVSGVSTSLLGHSYHADNTSVVSDLQMVLNLELPPGRRPRIEPRSSKRGPYWRFMP